MSLRLAENILGAINFSSLENSINFFDKDKKLKKILKNNFYKFIFLFFMIFLMLLIYLYFFFKDKKILKSYIFYIVLFLTTLIVYSFVYHRKDINLGLSFSSALLFSKILIDLKNEGKKVISTILFLLFATPTIIYASSRFSNYGDFYTTNNVFNYQNYLKNLNKNQNILLKDDKDYRYFYYFKNFEYNSENLKKFKTNNLFDFFNKFTNEEFIKPSS